MDNNAQNLTNAQNQPQTPTGPAPRPPMPGPAQMGAAPRPVAPPTPISAMPNLGGPRPAAATPSAPGTAPMAPNAAPTAPGVGPANPAAPAGAAPNGAPAPAKKGLSKKTLYIIIGCVAAVVIIACIVAAVIIMNPGKKNDTAPAPVVTQPQTTELAPLDELDKDGLIEAYDNMQASDYNPGDALTEPFLSEVHGHTVMLTDSYSDVDDLEGMTDLFDDQYDIDVQESENGTYATIMAVDEDSEPVEGEPLYVAFNEEYAIYDSSEGISATYFSADDSNPYLVDTSEDFAKEALPIVFLASGNYISNIYDIDFETDGDELIMTVSSIKYAYDTSASSSSSSPSSTSSRVTTDDNTIDEEEADADEESDSPYIIQALTDEMTADLETGVIGWSSDAETEISAFPITEDEFADGFTKMAEGIGLGAQADMLLNGGSLTIEGTDVTIEGPEEE